MSIRRNLIWLCAAPCLVAGLLLAIVLEPNGREHLVLGYLFGTMFGQATLASAWAALGPLPLLWRLPLSLVWLALLVGAITGNIAAHGGPREVPFVIGGCLAGQFAALQVPFWGLALGYRLRLRQGATGELKVDPRETQFGIRQLMIFTTVIAVFLGACRFAMTQFAQQDDLGGEAPIFIFLAVAAIVVTLPLVLAALLPRFAPAAVALVLVLIGLLTAWEVPLLDKFHNGPGPDTWHIIFINGFTSAWILATVVIVRISGYRLRTGPAIVSADVNGKSPFQEKQATR